MKYQEILNQGSKILFKNKILSSKLDSELILSKVLNKSREEIIININKNIDKEEQIKFNYYLIKRAKKKPIAHILGFKYFLVKELKNKYLKNKF